MAHTIIRPTNTSDTHPDEPNVRTDNELCQAVRAGNLVFPRGQVLVPDGESGPDDDARP